MVVDGGGRRVEHPAVQQRVGQRGVVEALRLPCRTYPFCPWTGTRAMLCTGLALPASCDTSGSLVVVPLIGSAVDQSP